ncbi:MAG: hypothetical protein ACOH5I_08400 [Oligoflexus sp.]
MKLNVLILTAVAAYFGPAPAKGQEKNNTVKSELPTANVLPLTPESFCSGLPNAFAITAQEFTIEANALCPGNAPSQAFRDLLTNAYSGQTNDPERIERDYIRDLPSSENITGNNIQIFIAYAMKVPRKGVEALLAEESFVETPYSRDILTINASFLPPPVNNGEADTAFSIEQKTNVNRTDNPQVIFNDVSRHELRMYRLHPNNFDFFLAVRTLAAPSEQFSKSVVLRGVLADAAAPNDSSYIVTVLNFIMNSRDEPDSNIAEGMDETFRDFISRDMQTIYTAHTQAANGN